MKKLIVFLFLLLFMLSTLALADSEYNLDYETEGRGGDPDYDHYVDIPLLSRLAPFTIIGGALCSEYPDRSGDITLSASQTRLCVTNTIHYGVAFQLFHTPLDEWGRVIRWDFLGEKQILKGDKKCFDGLIPGETYHWDTYWCDDLTKTCSKFESVCRTATSTKRVRYCEPGGREEVWVTWIDTAVGYCDDYEPPVPPPIPPVECDTNADCSSDKYCYQHQCILREPTDLKGFFTQIVAPSNIQPNEPIKVKAVFTAQMKGNYLLEAGIIEKPTALAIAVPSGSKCDGDKHWSGDFFELEKDESVELEFDFESRDIPGTYNIVIGAYTNCLEQGGSIITKESAWVNILGENGKPTNVWFYGLIALIIFAMYYVWKKVK